MARAFRHEDPRCGRERFDGRAGIDWEWGPNPNDTTYSIPDTPWNRINPGRKVVFDAGSWVVTEFGLELISPERDRYERYKVTPEQLLRTRRGDYALPLEVASEPWVDADAFKEFELAFKMAVLTHCRKPTPHRPSMSWFERAIWEMNGRPKIHPPLQPCLADSDTIERSFNRAWALVRQRTR